MKLHRLLLIGFFCVSMSPDTYAQDAAPLQLELSGTTDGTQAYDKTSIGLTITNTSGHTLSIERGIGVQKVSQFRWTPQMAIEAVADCTAYDQGHDWHAAVRIETGAALKVVPFDGGGCGGQCTEACTANFRLGAGTYRFAVMTREGVRVESPEFKLPSP